MKKRTGPTKKLTKKSVVPTPKITSPLQLSGRYVNGSFPVIGIGASAGGLEALQLFLKGIPARSGMAFIVIQHLDPTHKGIMAELLQRSTAMKVIQVKDRMKVEPDHVYVIPPNRDMSILHGILHLLDPIAPRGLRLPIDLFFRSLADDRKDKSIGVILSGMGSDGTLGLRAIKEKAGVVFVQAPESAKFDGMPRSAIDAGLADVVASIEELPGRIIAYLRHASLIDKPGNILEEKSQSALEKIFILLRTQTGQDFSLYKKSTKERIYRRLEAVQGTKPLELPAAFTTARPEEPAPAKRKGPAANIQTLMDKFIQTHYAPAAALTNEKGDILYISGRTGKYLEPAAGKANWNIFVMAREGLRYELGSAFQKALKIKDAVALKRLKVETTGHRQAVDITVRFLKEPEELKGLVMIVFADAVSSSATSHPRSSEQSTASGAMLRQAQLELREAREEVQSIRQLMQTSQEELTSVNEELQSTNEELQSTNEELTTSKEEMQSMNEELQTVNQELQVKVNDLSRVNNDMRNLLDSTDIATLFLDDNLNVRRFTNQMSKIIKLIPGDAGRPITDITSDLEYAELADDAREVLRTLMFKEKTVAGSGGRWFLVKIMPYRTMENRIDGLVITFADVTLSKTLEIQLRKTQAQLERRAMDSTGELEKARKELRKVMDEGKQRGKGA